MAAAGREDGIGFRDELSDRSDAEDSGEDGDDLNDPDLEKADREEMKGDDRYDSDGLVASDDESDGEDADDLDGEAAKELDKRIRRNARERKRKLRRDFRERDDRRKVRRADAGRDVGANLGYGALSEESDDSDTTAAPSAAGRAAAESVAGSVAGDLSEGGGEGDESDLYSSDDGQQVNFDEPEGKDLRDWLKQEPVKKDIKRKFSTFLRTFREEPNDGKESHGKGESMYMERIHRMVTEGKQSLLIKYRNLASYNIQMAMYLAEMPGLMFKLLEEVATNETMRKYDGWPKIMKQLGIDRIHVRFVDLPISDPIRSLRVMHMDMLVRVNGVVTRRSQVYPQLQAVKFDCLKCSFTIGPLTVRGDQEPKCRTCPYCQGSGPFKLNAGQTIYRNYQTIVLQESPGSVPPGRLPRYIECILLYDLVDQAKPGDHIEITGVYKNMFDPLLNHKQGFPVFSSVMEVNSIQKTSDDQQASISEDERQEFITFSKHPNAIEKLRNSIAPSIHGNEHIKAGICCSLFGAVRKEIGETPKHRVRGDINVLLVGDPGCGKSQFLKYVEKTSPRAVFTTGRGSTAVGLTAAVHKDAMTGEWTLEGGAMVTADKGHCLIDEFDKMSDADRTSIHEAMEQQTISIAKAGIVTTLQARCAIIAAANPVTGQYDSSQTFEQQVNLTQPILSRFDLLFAVRDNVNTRTDTQLAKFIINSHIRNWSTGISPESHPLIPEEMFREEAQLLPGVTDVTADTDLESTNPLPQEWLRKYILYARGNCNPRIEQINFAKIERLYAKLRGDSAMKYESGVKIVVRHLESMLRLSEAFARMRLGDYVRDDDVNRAISLFLNCFLQTLPHKRSQEMKKRYMDFLVLEKQHNDVIIHVLGTLTEQERRARQYHKDFAYDTIEIQYDELLQAAEQYKIYDRDIAKFVKNDMRLHDQYTIITKSGAPEPIDHEDIKAFRWSPNKTSG